MTLIEAIELTGLLLVALALWEMGIILRRTNSLLRQQCRQLNAIANELGPASDEAEVILQ